MILIERIAAFVARPADERSQDEADDLFRRAKRYDRQAIKQCLTAAGVTEKPKLKADCVELLRVTLAALVETN